MQIEHKNIKAYGIDGRDNGLFRCEIYFLRFFYFFTQICKNIPFSPYCNIFRFIIMFHIYAQLAFGQIPYMAVACRHFITGT